MSGMERRFVNRRERSRYRDSSARGLARLAIVGVAGVVLLVLAGSVASGGLVGGGVSRLATAGRGVCTLTTHGRVASGHRAIDLPPGAAFYSYATVTGGKPIHDTSFVTDFAYADPWLSGPGKLILVIGHSKVSNGSDKTSSLYPVIGGTSVSSVPYARSVYLAQNSTTLDGTFYLANSSDVLLVAALSEDYTPTLNASSFHVVAAGGDNPVDSILIAKAALTTGWHSFALNSTAWIANSVIGAVLYYFAANTTCAGSLVSGGSTGLTAAASGVAGTYPALGTARAPRGDG